MRVNLREISEAARADAGKPLWDGAGDLKDYEPFHNRILAATYVPPPRVFKGPNGEDIQFHESDRKLDEHRFQGKVGLVLKVGPLAFKDDSTAKFGGITVKPGDWIIFHHNNAYELYIRDRRKSNDGMSCWLVQDVFVEGRVSDPSLIY